MEVQKITGGVQSPGGATISLGFAPAAVTGKSDYVDNLTFLLKGGMYFDKVVCSS